MALDSVFVVDCDPCLEAKISLPIYGRVYGRLLDAIPRGRPEAELGLGQKLTIRAQEKKNPMVLWLAGDGGHSSVVLRERTRVMVEEREGEGREKREEETLVWWWW